MMMEAESTTNETMSEASGERSIALNDKRDAVLTCCICLQVVSKKGKLLPCLHTLCRPCEITGMSENKLTCTFCNQSWNSNDIVEHFLLKYLEAEPEAPKCDNCEENMTAKFKCVQCNDFLCLECSRAHQRVKITKDHNLAEIESSNESPLDELKCPKHKNEDILWFCQTCDQNTCRNCQLESHSGHQYCTLESSVKKHHQEIQLMHTETRKKIMVYEQVVAIARQRITEIDQADRSLRQDLMASIEQLQKNLAERGKSLLADIQTVTNSKRNWYTQLKNVTENLDHVAKQVMHFTELTNECAKTVDIKQAHNKIAAAVNYVDSMNARLKNDFNNLQVPIQLSLVLPNSDFIKQISQYGMLIVDTLPPHVAMFRQRLDTPVNQSGGGGGVNPSFPQAGSPTVRSGTAPGSSCSVRGPSPQQRAPAPSKTSRRRSIPQTSGQQQQQQQIPHLQEQHHSPSTVRELLDMQAHGHSSRNLAFVSDHAQTVAQNSAQIINQTQLGSRLHVRPPQRNQQPAMGGPGHHLQPNQQLIRQPNQMLPVVSQVYSISQDALNNGINNSVQQVPRFPPNVNYSFSPSGQEICAVRNVLVNQIQRPQIQNVSQMQYTNVPFPLTATFSGSVILNEQQRQQLQLQQCISLQNQPVQRPNFILNHSVSSHPMASAGQAAQAPPPLMRFSGQVTHPGSVQTVLKSLAPRPTIFCSVGSQSAVQPPAANAIPAPPPYQLDNQLIQLVQITSDNPTSSDGRSPEKRPPPTSATSLVVATTIPCLGTNHTSRILPVITLDHQTSNENQNKDPSDEAPLASQSISNKTASALDSLTAMASQVNNSELASPTNRNSPKNSTTGTTITPLKSSRAGVRLAKKSIGNTSSYNERSKKSTGSTDEAEPLEAPPTKRPKTTSPVETTEAPGQEPRPNSSISCYPLTEPFECPSFDDDVIICSPYKSAVCSTPTNIIDSSSDNIGHTKLSKVEPIAGQENASTVAGSQDKDDREWEDYCSVCQNGGELLCCEAQNCTRVFHYYDHIPQFSEVPNSKFICGFCINLEDFKSSEDKTPSENRIEPRLTAYEQKLCEKMLLELYCHPESPPFHVPVDESFEAYFKVIKRPIDFFTIRSKLASISAPYRSVIEFIEDVNQVFQNCSTFNDEESETGKAGLSVGRAYKNFVRKYCPEYLRFVKRSKRL